MPESTEFGALYKKLLDSHFEPDPERSAAALRAVLRQLSLSDFCDTDTFPMEQHEHGV